ncbi:hypothetical protein ACFV0T_06930 [Streptomyces sp. NPDC059582]|uniref:hypothetical protein n=1 Tax=Streptomyces sp. NPDC059582 TaxID=3346875 RepID=UPI0036A1D030
MSATTDWLSATGGIIGAIGGPAGLWAAWSQHRESRRGRMAGPEELLSLIGKVRDVALSVTVRYKDDAWFAQAGGDAVADRIKELAHLVGDDLLRYRLDGLTDCYRDMRRSLTSPYQAEEERFGAVSRQAQEAERLMAKADELLKEIRKRR